MSKRGRPRAASGWRQNPKEVRSRPRGRDQEKSEGRAKGQLRRPAYVGLKLKVNLPDSCMRAQRTSATLVKMVPLLSLILATLMMAGTAARQEVRAVDWRRVMLGRARKERRRRPRVWRVWRSSRRRRGWVGGKVRGWMATETPSVRITPTLGPTNMRRAARNKAGGAEELSWETRRSADTLAVVPRRVWANNSEAKETNLGDGQGAESDGLDSSVARPGLPSLRACHHRVNPSVRRVAPT